MPRNDVGASLPGEHYNVRVFAQNKGHLRLLLRDGALRVSDGIEGSPLTLRCRRWTARLPKKKHGTVDELG